MQNLSLIFHLFSLIIFAVMLILLAQKNQKLNYHRKIFEKLQTDSGKIVDNPCSFVNYLCEEFNINLEQNAKIEKPTIILTKLWFEFLLRSKVKSLSWVSEKHLLVVTEKKMQYTLDGAFGKNIKIEITQSSEEKV